MIAVDRGFYCSCAWCVTQLIPCDWQTSPALVQAKPKGDNSIVVWDLRGRDLRSRYFEVCGYTSTPDYYGNRVHAEEFSGASGVDDASILAKRGARSPDEKTHASSTSSQGRAGWEVLRSQLRSDESGSTLIEYTLLLSLVTLALVGLIIFTGGWAAGMWTNLLLTLGA